MLYLGEAHFTTVCNGADLGLSISLMRVMAHFCLHLLIDTAVVGNTTESPGYLGVSHCSGKPELQLLSKQPCKNFRSSSQLFNLSAVVCGSGNASEGKAMPKG